MFTIKTPTYILLRIPKNKVRKSDQVISIDPIKNTVSVLRAISY